MNKIKEEELQTIVNQQKRVEEILREVGYLEASKHGLLHKLAGVNEEVEATKKKLEQEYGAVNINLEDGTYTEIENSEEETPVAAI